MRGEKGRKVLIGRVWTKTIRGSVYTLGKGLCRNDCTEKYHDSFELGKNSPGVAYQRVTKDRWEKQNNNEQDQKRVDNRLIEN